MREALSPPKHRRVFRGERVLSTASPDTFSRVEVGVVVCMLSISNVSGCRCHRLAFGGDFLVFHTRPGMQGSTIVLSVVEGAKSRCAGGGPNQRGSAEGPYGTLKLLDCESIPK